MQTDALQPNFELSMCNIFNSDSTGRNVHHWGLWGSGGGKNKILSPDKTDSLAFSIAVLLTLPLALSLWSALCALLLLLLH